MGPVIRLGLAGNRNRHGRNVKKRRGEPRENGRITKEKRKRRGRSGELFAGGLPGYCQVSKRIMVYLVPIEPDIALCNL